MNWGTVLMAAAMVSLPVPGASWALAPGQAPAAPAGAAPPPGSEGTVPESPAGGGAGGPAAAGREGQRAPTSHFLHLDARVSIDEWANRMDVRVRITLLTGRQTDGFWLVLNPAMCVSSMVDESFGALAWTRFYGGFHNVSLGRSVAGGTTLNVSIDYGGQVAYSEDGGQTYWDLVAPGGSWVRPYAAFFPFDEERDRTTSRLAITVPEGRLAVAGGEDGGSFPDPANGTVTYVWVNRRPVSGLAFVSGVLNRTVVTFGQNPYLVCFRPSHSGSAQSYASELDRVRSFYASFLGPAGFQNLTVVEVPDTFAAWGQTVPSMVWLASRNFSGPFPYRLLAHELGHQWFGVDVEGRQLQDNWVQEGFAGYCEALYEMSAYGSRGYLDYCRTQYLNQFVGPNSSEPALVSNSYDLAATKGPWVLHMLRYLAGDQPFYRSLYEFHQNFSGRQASPEDYAAEAEAACNLELSGFFDFWLNTSGRLDYGLTDPVDYQGEGASHRLEMTVWRGAPAGGLPVDIAFYDGAGARIDSIPRGWNASGPGTVFRLELDHPVDTVRLDPDGWLLDIQLSNNEAPTREARLDFSVKGLALSPAGPMEGERCLLEAELASASTQGPNMVEVELLEDGDRAGNATALLPASGRTAVNFTLAPAAGTHLLTVRLDPLGLYFQTNTSNDLSSLDVTVLPRPPPLPDLRILPGGIHLAPAGAVEGSAAALTALVENIGTAPAENVSVRFWVDSTGAAPAAWTDLDGIPAGGGVLASAHWTAAAGVHEVTAGAELRQGGENSTGDNMASALIYVNARPVALLAASQYEAGIGEWVDLSGASSADDGRVVYFFFDFGDGETAGWQSENRTSHCYASRGSFAVRLKVEDDTGAESDWSPPVTIRVRGAPPVALLQVRPASGDVRTLFLFSSLYCATDGGPAEALWNFGDGQRASGTEVNHSYRTHGDFNVSLTVRDPSGLSAQAFALVRVHDLPPMPAISLDRTSALVGEKVGFSANGTSDQDDPFANLTFMWDFGDGQRAAGAATAYAFRHPGVYRVVLLATDGDQSAETATFVTVRSPAPAAAGAAGGATWLSWVVLLALLGAMALLVIAMLLPDGKKKRGRMREEEE